jgi:AraC-like DNA-binding protein
LYDFCVVDDPRIRAWRPPVPGVAEVLHAHMTSHVYPMHTHQAWTLLIVDDGMIRYDLHRHEHGAPHQAVTLLPPQVPHNGRAATSSGFRKRVVYLDLSQLPAGLIGRAVDQPVLFDPLLRTRIHQLHRSLEEPGEELEAESRLAFVAERLRRHLSPRGASAVRGGTGLDDPDPDGTGLDGTGLDSTALDGTGLDSTGLDSTVADSTDVAHRLRELIDARFREKVTLRQASQEIHAHPAHLVRMFSREFGISPHQYLAGRRIDLARGLLLDGMPASLAAAAAGFCDQSHLSRSFRRVLGTSPGRYTGR